jgi:hypothetical protein
MQLSVRTRAGCVGSGQGDGRIYTITYEAKDGSGNVTTSAVTVTVPRSQSSP